MWTRALLKSNAKTVLRRSYWRVFLACLIVTALSGGLKINVDIGDAAPISGNAAVDYVLYQLTGNDLLDLVLNFVLVVLGLGAWLALIVLGLCWGFLFTAVLQVGTCRYLVQNRAADPGLGTLFSGFTGGRYWNVVAGMFYSEIRIIGYTFLLVVPGIIKSYQYRFVPYLLAENPDLAPARAAEISTIRTEGEKWNIFVLDLSFIGWNILGAMLFGIGGLFVTPYVEATRAELYAALRAKVVASGYVSEAELAGEY